MSIRKLPDSVVDKLRSTVVITSLNGVVLGLLRNSLDASASKVNIAVDYSRGNCTVEDNGLGISADAFGEGGGLGRPHHTSRFPPRDDTFGKHGNFLASLASLSLLSVASRNRRDLSCNSILFHNSTVLARHLPASPEQSLRTFDCGTRVIVRDLFGSMPVRVKQRAVISSERSNIDREWMRLIAETVATLLSWNSTCAVSVREITSQREIQLRPPDGSDMISRTSRLLVQASLADAAHTSSWVPVSASAGHIMVKGCISTSPVVSSRCQFISVGINPLSNEYGTNVVYQEVNKVFSNSNFGVLEIGGRGQPASDKTPVRYARNRKGVDRWPMFYFRIRMRDSRAIFHADDIMDNRTNDLAEILDLLKTMCYGFLKKQHLGPKKVRSSTAKESNFSTAKAAGRSKAAKGTAGGLSIRPPPGLRNSQVTIDSPFDSWKRIKVGQVTNQGDKKVSEVEAASHRQDRPSQWIEEDGRLLRQPFEDVEADSHEETSVHFSGIPNSATAANDRWKHEMGNPRFPRPEPSSWLKNVLRSWENPVFENAAQPVPRSYDDRCLPTGEGQHTRHGCDVMFESKSVNMSGRISKAALREAEVIGQVDRKFILVKLALEDAKGSFGSHALAMLDQHAIDERCQLEDLMASYFIQDGADGAWVAQTELLDQNINFEVDPNEALLFQKHLEHFHSWGISYRPRTGTTSRDASCRIEVTHLPPTILERCRMEPRLIIDLLREEVWKLTEGQHTQSGSGRKDDWPSRFHGCPRGILELLHSRSCRSAIMFNDVLTKEECVKMVQRVAKCSFPFQCAHGRPSMAPLVDLGGSDGWAEEDTQHPDWKGWVAGHGTCS